MTRSDSSTTLKRLEKGRFELQEEIKQLERYIEHTGKEREIGRGEGGSTDSLYGGFTNEL